MECEGSVKHVGKALAQVHSCTCSWHNRLLRRSRSPQVGEDIERSRRQSLPPGQARRPQPRQQLCSKMRPPHSHTRSLRSRQRSRSVRMQRTQGTQHLKQRGQPHHPGSLDNIVDFRQVLRLQSAKLLLDIQLQSDAKHASVTLATTLATFTEELIKNAHRRQ